jgi:hypothetical protein
MDCKAGAALGISNRGNGLKCMHVVRSHGSIHDTNHNSP